MLKFLLDVGVGDKVAQYLIASGYDTVSTTSIDPTLPDSVILSMAEKDGRMVITMDKDFGDLVYHSEKAHKGVLLLRLEDANGEEKVEIMRFIIENFSDKLEGKFCVFKNGQLRIKYPPSVFKGL